MFDRTIRESLHLRAWMRNVPFGRQPRTIEEGSNEEGSSRFLVPEGTERGGLPDSRIFGDRGSRGDGGRGDEASEGGARRGSEPPPGAHPLAPRDQAPFDPATEPSLVTISEELATAERELRHLRIKTQGQPAEGGPTAAEGIPDAEKEVGRLEQQYEAEANSGGGILPLAPTAQRLAHPVRRERASVRTPIGRRPVRRRHSRRRLPGRAPCLPARSDH